MKNLSVPCVGPRSTRSCGGRAGRRPQTLEGATTAREWEKFRLELKCAIPVDLCVNLSVALRIHVQERLHHINDGANAPWKK